MAIIYVRSTDGSNADNGSTWALAKASLAGADAIDAAGDTIYVSQVHAESTAAAVTWNFAGTAASMTKIIGVSDAAEPPTALNTGNTVTVTGANNLGINGSLYADSINFVCGAAINFASTTAIQHYKSCKFKTTNIGSSGQFAAIGNNNLTRLVFESCTFYFTNAANRFVAEHSIWIRGGGLETGTASPTAMFTMGADGRGGELIVEDFDFSNGGSTMGLVNGSSAASGVVTFRNCKLPASWSGSLVTSGLTSPALRVKMINCDSTNTNYRMWIEDYCGTIKSETTLVKTGGASDGTTPISWKVVTTANTSYPAEILRTEPIMVWNSTTGSSVTATIDILRDSATNLKDDEVWIEAHYLGTSGFPLGTMTVDAKTDIFATAADQTASTATWTTTGMANPNKQKLSVTFTPQVAGFISARVCIAKASTTLYIDPLIQVA